MTTYSEFRPTGFDCRGRGLPDRQSWFVAPVLRTMRNYQQWDALCEAWNAADAALAHYRPTAHTGIQSENVSREEWLSAVAVAARQSTGWLRLPEEEQPKNNCECHLTIRSECGKFGV